MKDAISPLARRIVRLLIACALSGVLANTWSVVPLEIIIPAAVAGHYLLLSIFSHFIARSPRWSILLASVRELLLTCVQFSMVLWVGLGLILYSTGSELERPYKLFVGLLSIVLSLIFLLLFTTHTIIHRHSIRQRWLSFTTGQMFAVTLVLAGAMYLNATTNVMQPSFNLVPAYQYGWPLPCLSVTSETPQIDILCLLGNVILFAVPCTAFLVLCGGTPNATKYASLRPRMIALGLLIFLVVALSIPTTVLSPSSEFPLFRRYGWPITFYEEYGGFGGYALLLNLYSYALFSLIIFSVRSNDLPQRAESSA